MALPQKALEQLAREPTRTPGWSGRLLMFTGTLLLVGLVIYFGLTLGYKPFLDGKVQELKNQIEKFNTQIKPQDQERLIGIYSQIVNLRNLLDKQRTSSVIFPWLEENSHVGVHFLSFGLNSPKRTVTLSARATSIQAIVEQLSLFEYLPEVENVSFSGTTVDKDGFWAFGLGLTLSDEFFSSAFGAVGEEARTGNGER